MIVLSGDVGGTNTRLALVEYATNIPTLLVDQVFPSCDYTTFYDVLNDFITMHGENFDAVSIGVAGPVLDDCCHVTNLPWEISAIRIREELAVEHVFILNDLEAIAWGVQVLNIRDFHVLNAGKNLRGNAAVIAAGTGLGEAGLYFDGSGYRPFACEGGHADFVPSGVLGIPFNNWLAEEYGHVSWERVVSGAGLVHIYDFLLQHHGIQVQDWLEKKMLNGSKPAVISEVAMVGTDPICVEALNMFVRFYAAEAGNLALKMMAYGGVYLAGGIAPEILGRLCQKDFMEIFCAKGRMSALLQNIPVRVVLNEKVGLIGAALFAHKAISL